MFSNAISNDLLIDRLTRAVALGDEHRVVERVQAEVSELARGGGVELPATWGRPLPDGYARRLLFRDPLRRFTIVCMTWGPKQGTPIHDHGGLWCVECVVRGRIEAEQFRIVPLGGENAYRFVSFGITTDEVGMCGAMVPPHEHHRMANPSTHETAITLHVYGGELERCNAFIPCADGYYCREERQLSYLE